MLSYKRITEVATSSVKKITICYGVKNFHFSVKKLNKREQKKHNAIYAINEIFTNYSYYSEDEFLKHENSYIVKTDNGFDIFYRPFIQIEYVDGDYDKYYAPFDNIEEEKVFLTMIYERLRLQIKTLEIQPRQPLIV